jgi:hypothetical protein
MAWIGITGMGLTGVVWMIRAYSIARTSAPQETDGMPIGCEVLLRRYSERVSCATREGLP